MDVHSLFHSRIYTLRNNDNIELDLLHFASTNYCGVVLVAFTCKLYSRSEHGDNGFCVQLVLYSPLEKSVCETHTFTHVRTHRNRICYCAYKPPHTSTQHCKHACTQSNDQIHAQLLIHQQAYDESVCIGIRTHVYTVK